MKFIIIQDASEFEVIIKEEGFDEVRISYQGHVIGSKSERWNESAEKIKPEWQNPTSNLHLPLPLPVPPKPSP